MRPREATRTSEGVCKGHAEREQPAPSQAMPRGLTCTTNLLLELKKNNKWVKQGKKNKEKLVKTKTSIGKIEIMKKTDVENEFYNRTVTSFKYLSRP